MTIEWFDDDWEGDGDWGKILMSFLLRMPYQTFSSRGTGIAMRIALYQGTGVAGATAENIEIIREAAAEAATAGAELIVFPELFLTGYNLPDELRELAEPADGPAAKRIADICRNYAIAILYGYPEAADGLFWNSAQLFDRKGGGRGNYRKVHLAPGFERDLFAAGDSFTVMTLGELSIGALICYDVEFPEAARAEALQGADVIAVLSATSDRHPEVSRIMVPARAAENQLFVAFANRGGREGTLVYGGGSCIVGPDGTDILRFGPEQRMTVVNLDLDAIGRRRSRFTYLSDRRAELYGA